MEKKWYQQTWAIIVLLWLFFPIGVYLMWRHASWGLQIKWAVSGAIAVLFVLVVVVGAVGGDDDGDDSELLAAGTSTPEPTATPELTATPEPTATLEPTETPVPPPTPEPTEVPAGPATTFGDGVHVVGVDIAPGTYRGSPSGSCYWARLSGFSGELDDIIANDNSEAPIVTISASDVGFESSRCGTWTRIGD